MAAGDPLTVLFANNYDMARARAGWQAGTYPAHHLYGTAELGESFEVVDLPFSGGGRLTRLTRGKLGDPGQQLAALRERRRPAVVYAAAAHELRALATLRALRLVDVPIVGVFHGVPAPGLLNGALLRGFDRAIALSRCTRRALLDGGMPAARIQVLGWGPDLDFPGFQPLAAAARDAPVVATGKTGRDMRTLLAALAATGLRARVYCRPEQVDRTAAIPDHVELLAAEPAGYAAASGPLHYGYALDDLRSAAVVAIPLLETRPLHGLTEVVDALACGRPMILTRAPYFDFDIEAIGCGWWVGHGDLDGWCERLTDAMSDRERLDEMGRAGRSWAEEHLNARLFGEGVREVLLEAVSS